jgi:hypothetical protein
MRFNGPSRVEGFVPGSLEGVWEGGFLVCFSCISLLDGITNAENSFSISQTIRNSSLEKKKPHRIFINHRLIGFMVQIDRFGD